MMITRAHIKEWVFDAVKALGEGSPASVAKHIWDHHETELRSAGDLFYTWQYESRWAAQNLQKEGRLLKTGRIWKFIK
ncbi:hypothetical protein SAMN05216456_3643 [Devosia crocina]|uniref:Uncharacterized protein n=1 Tax=Devosia crocina TaxID=429728 RepID=A0A1I7NVZ3_9HYPH|nr:hypothetical protein SAMN05216456_3643 [Devosia crocina]